jgi:prevent-host-death family protein
MRKIAATDLKANLAAVLGDVERGEIVDITRHGKVIARIAPQAEDSLRSASEAVDRLKAWRKTLPPTKMTVADILSARDEGRP